MPQIPLVPLGSQGAIVSQLGLGCMVLSGTYAQPDEAESIATFHRALDLGITFLDTADAYSQGGNEQFVGAHLGRRRDDVLLASKFGLVTVANGLLSVDGRPSNVHRSCDASLQRLGTDHIDLYYLHRIDPAVPVEETVGAMAALVAAGKVRYLGLCETSADELRRAHHAHPITALQSEWSLWAREIEDEVLPTARELGIGIVPYGPLGRGFLTGAITAGSLSDTDARSGDPRFADEHFARNMELVEILRTMAAGKDSTPAQLALAWLRHQGDDIVPIPGTEKRTYLDDNVRSLQVQFDAAELDLLDHHFRRGAVAGKDALAGLSNLRSDHTRPDLEADD